MDPNTLHDLSEKRANERLFTLGQNSEVHVLDDGLFAVAVPGGTCYGATRDEAIFRAALFNVYYKKAEGIYSK